MSTVRKVRYGFLALFVILVMISRGNPHAMAMVMSLRIVFYVGLAGYFIYAYIARRRQSDKLANPDVAPLTAAPIQPAQPVGTARPDDDPRLL